MINYLSNIVIKILPCYLDVIYIFEIQKLIQFNVSSFHPLLHLSNETLQLLGCLLDLVFFLHGEIEVFPDHIIPKMDFILEGVIFEVVEGRGGESCGSQLFWRVVLKEGDSRLDQINGDVVVDLD